MFLQLHEPVGILQALLLTRSLSRRGSVSEGRRTEQAGEGRGSAERAGEKPGPPHLRIAWFSRQGRPVAEAE